MILDAVRRFLGGTEGATNPARTVRVARMDEAEYAARSVPVVVVERATDRNTVRRISRALNSLVPSTGRPQPAFYMSPRLGLAAKSATLI